MSRHALAPAALILLLWQADAIASPPGPDEIFAEQDLDRDGFIDRHEARVAAAIDHRELDADGDGVLVIEELDPMIAEASPVEPGFPIDLHLQLRRDVMGKRDADGDGRITLAENQESWVRDMSIVDSDGDGRISLQELRTLRRTPSPSR